MVEVTIGEQEVYLDRVGFLVVATDVGELQRNPSRGTRRRQYHIGGTSLVWP